MCISAPASQPITQLQPIDSFTVATDSEWLECTTHDNTASEWDENGVEPWLDADDSNTIDTKVDAETHSYFGFGSTSLTGTITVNVSILCWNDDGAGNDHFSVYYNIGSGDNLVADNVGDQTTPTYETFSVGDFTATQVNAMEFSFVSEMVTQPDEVYVDHLRIGLSSEGGGDSYDVTINDVITIDDIASTVVNLSQLAQDVITVYDSTSTVVNLSQLVQDVITFYDSISTVVNFSQLVQEIIDVESTISTVLNATIGISDIISIMDSVTTILNPSLIITLVINELLPIAEITEVVKVFNIFNELFLSVGIWGYFGPLALIVAGVLLIKKEKMLALFFIIVDSLVIAQYLTLVEATPDYWWHIYIMIFGVITCMIQGMMSR